MAQIIKHRRGSIDSLKGALANKGELVIATGSIGNLNGPFLFVGDSDANGAFKSTTKIYQGNVVPTINAGTYGTTLDGVPFYSNDEKSLYILDSTLNQKIDLSGNLEGTTISGVTINNLQSTNVTASFVSASFVGDATGLYNIPATGVTGLNLSKIYSGSVQVTTDSVTGDIHLDATNDIAISTTNNFSVTGSNLYLYNTGGEMEIGQLDQSAYFYTDGSYVEMYSNDEIYIDADNSMYIQVNNGESGIYIDQNVIELTTYTGNININAINDGTAYSVNISGSLNVNVTGSVDVNLYAGNNVNLEGSAINVTGSVYQISGESINTDKIIGATNHLNIIDLNDIVLGNLGLFSSNDINMTGSNIYMVGSGNITGSAEVINFRGSTYSQLESNNSYVWVETDGAYLQNENTGVAGFTARPNSVAEITGSLNIDGNTQINGNTSVTGALVVSNGSATFDQGLVAQNSNMLLTSGSNLVIQDGGNLGVAGNVYVTGSEYVDTIFGKTNTNNYLAFNGGAVGAPGVELNSDGNISLWAEGGYVNVTGSMKVTGDVTVEQNMYVSGNIYQTGSFYTQGDIVLSGSINIGNSLTGDTINFGGEVNSHILPTTGATYNLGSSGQTWNNVYAEYYYGDGSHLTNISLTGITGLNKIVDGAVSASILEVGGFQVNTDSAFTGSVSIADYNTLYTNEIYGNDNSYLDIAADGNIWINTFSSYAYFEVNEGDAGLYVTNNGDQTEFYNYSGDIGVRSYNNNTYIGGQNTYLESYNGTLYLNDDSNNDININGDSYFSTSRTMYVSNMRDNNDNVNYLQLYGSNTDNGYWWESGTGRDTTLFNDESSNVNILARSGKVNIDASDTLSIHTNNGVQITGSLVVSDASGVFNSSLVVNNSDLTLDGGSNIHMNDGAHLYFDTCVDMYYDNGSNNFVFYNDCNAFSFQNNISVTGSINVSGDVYLNNNNTLYTNYIYGYDGGDLNIQTDNSTLHINQSYDTYIDSNNYMSIGWNDEWNYTYYESGGIYTWSEDGYIEMGGNNNSGESNYIYIENDGVWLKTQHYDGTGTTTHDVWLDNTGSLNLVNVNLHTDGNIKVGGDLEVTGSLKVSGTTTMSGSVTMNSDLYVSGNIYVYGTGTTVNLDSNTVNIGDNIILVNAYSPFQRYAGISGYDSGSMGNSGSLLWDSLNNYWNFVDQYNSSSQIIGTTAAGLGNEVSLTANTLPKATSANTIGNSLITDDGTVFTYNTNKFTITGDTGDTYISGNLQIAASGGTDNGTLTSYIVFRNSDDMLGFVDKTDTETESDALLGYNTSTGVLQFSSLIDGGLY